MSVLVKGMKMPMSCEACRFRTSDSESVDPFTDYCFLTNARLGYYDNKRARWKKERKKNCPLVEVAISPCEGCAILSEVRHGRWEKHLVPTDFDGEVFNVEHIVCSVCESSIPLNKTYKRDWYSDYCPSCGSRMDLDEVEE